MARTKQTARQQSPELQEAVTGSVLKKKKNVPRDVCEQLFSLKKWTTQPENIGLTKHICAGAWCEAVISALHASMTS